MKQYFYIIIFSVCATIAVFAILNYLLLVPFVVSLFVAAFTAIAATLRLLTVKE